MGLFMMSEKRFIKIPMKKTANNMGGSFATKASFRMDHINMPFQDTAVKIDTGCSISVIPMGVFGWSSSKYRELKRKDIENNVYSIASYGVETGGMKHKKPVTFEEKLNCTALKFEHKLSEFSIGGMKIHHDCIFVNYDRRGNILIGMDILKDWDIHIGTIHTGETIFLACPYDQINEAYFMELEQVFGLGRYGDNGWSGLR